MKVLLISQTLKSGGAARGALNLKMSLIAAGIDVVVLTKDDFSDMRSYRVARTLERCIEHLLIDGNNHCLKFARSSINLITAINKVKPDLLQLCNISGNVVDFDQLSKLKIPIVHRMSDLWPYAGPAHYNLPKNSYKSNIANSFFNMNYDLSLLKNLNLVAPSDWLLTEIKRSNFSKLHRGKTKVILNAVDTPKIEVPNKLIKKELNLGFISQDINSRRKGLARLLSVLNHMNGNSKQLQLHLFGKGKFDRRHVPKHVSVIPHGQFNNKDMKKVFSKIDVLCVPSREDNSPNVVTEAMSYGVPSIGQIGTGIESYIKNCRGALIDFWGEDSQASHSFLIALDKIRESYHIYSRNCYEYTVQDLSYLKIGLQYKSFFDSLLEKNK